MEFQHFWADMHSNIHHGQMGELEKWYRHARQVMDFWPIAYYPFAMRRTPAGAGLEDLIPQADYEADWEQVRALARRARAEGWPLFMGYEWQGDGSDGDHNLFFLDDDAPILHPRTYRALREATAGREVIAVPHHMAYRLGSRGKNWDTHDETFSPIAELYSSHGSSENDEGPFGMDRHVHMGPRVGSTSYEAGLRRGLKVGAIASGDNHAVPGEATHGMMCVLAENGGREAIWQGLRARRTYGVSRSRIRLDFTIGGVPMGGEVPAGRRDLRVAVVGANAVDRVELLRDNVLEKMYVHSGTWERAPLPGRFRFKFEVEFGWGADTRDFPEAAVKEWRGRLAVPGRLLSVEKLWNSFGQTLSRQDEKGCDFTLTTSQKTETGKWMGVSQTKREGFIFEVEGTLDDCLTLTVDGKDYPLPVAGLLADSAVYAQYDEAREMVFAKYPDAEHYRDDLIWHSAFKFRVRRAAPESAWDLDIRDELELRSGSQYRLRVWQKNGDAAWSSPVFCV